MTIDIVSFQKWLSHEIEVLISIADAKHHLDSLKQDRADLVKQKKALQEKLEYGPSPAKVFTNLFLN